MKFFCKSQRDEKNHHHHQQQQHQPQLEEEETVTVPTSQMGQFSSTEVQAASAVAGKAVISSAASICAAENATEGATAKQKERTAANLALFRPSQPIDIRGSHLGAGRPRAEQQQYRRPLPNPLEQQEASVQQEHKPRVIQPRRLSGSPSASIGPIRSTVGGGGGGGRNDLSNCRERIWQEAMRRRLLSLDSRLVDAAASAAIVVDPECPSSSGENNKENRQEKEAEGKGILEEEAGTFNKRLSRSRKRLNSAELDYEGTNGNENAGTTGQKATEEEAMEKEVTDGIQTIPIERQQTQQQPEPPMARRGGGRIAYLYGVYGEERQCHSPLFLNQHRTTATAKTMYPDCRRNYGMTMDYSWTDEEPTRTHLFGSDYYVECCLEMDGQEAAGTEFEDDGEDHMERLARLHTVSDIIGYAKVVRAQRQETLGRLNDVMSQFDALIRSYSMAMKTSGGGGQQQQTETAEMGANQHQQQDEHQQQYCHQTAATAAGITMVAQQQQQPKMA